MISVALDGGGGGVGLHWKSKIMDEQPDYRTAFNEVGECWWCGKCGVVLNLPGYCALRSIDQEVVLIKAERVFWRRFDELWHNAKSTTTNRYSYAVRSRSISMTNR